MREKGSALITVILVVLVLTMVGLAALFFMTTEERIAQVTRLEKAAFYAAEVGLRRAENVVLEQYRLNNSVLTLMLTRSNINPVNQWNIIDVPNGGDVHPTAVVLRDIQGIDPEVANQRTDPALQIIDPTNAAIPAREYRGFVVDNQQGYVSTYSLYIRNDDDDQSETVDSNDRVSIISVGMVVTPTGQVIRKVLEEWIAPVGAGGAGFQFQYLKNKMGTSA